MHGEKITNSCFLKISLSDCSSRADKQNYTQKVFVDWWACRSPHQTLCLQKTQPGETNTAPLLKQILWEVQNLPAFGHTVIAKETVEGICALWNDKFTWKPVGGQTVTYTAISQKGCSKSKYALQRKTVKGNIDQQRFPRVAQWMLFYTMWFLCRSVLFTSLHFLLLNSYAHILWSFQSSPQWNHCFQLL